MIYYEGDKPCPSCGKPGTEIRKAADARCFSYFMTMKPTFGFAVAVTVSGSICSVMMPV